MPHWIIGIELESIIITFARLWSAKTFEQGRRKIWMRNFTSYMVLVKTQQAISIHQLQGRFGVGIEIILI